MLAILLQLRTLVVAVPLAVGLVPASAAAQHVAVIVNGDPITEFDIEQRRKLIQISTRKSPTRQQVIDELIDEMLKVREGKRWTIEVSNAEVDRAFATMASRMRFTPDQLTQSLARSGINAQTLKARVRADLVWNQLVRGRYQASLQVADSDVRGVLETKSTDDNAAVGYDYTLRPILFLVPPGAGRPTFETRKREAEALRARFKSCDEGIPLARALRDVAVREQLSRSSSSMPAVTRKQLDEVPVGQLTAPDITRHGVEMFAVCGKRQTTVDTPGKAQARDEVFAKRFAAKSTQYLQQLRRNAMIEYR
jgi:peptidyl-prolyl cis-trans isomerase SurA